MRAAYRLAMPNDITTPVVVASPHSGRYYPSAFLDVSVLDEQSIRSSEDAFVDMLIADAPKFGAPLLVAEYPRAYVDLNRNIDEVDPQVVQGVGAVAKTPRIHSGLGVIPRVVAHGRAIYRGKLTQAEARSRIDRIWKPYHAQLDRLMTHAHERFGHAILVDFHSMPHDALNGVAHPGGPRPDVVLGDRFGASAARDFVDALEAAFFSAGLCVCRNAPFAGAFVIQHYGCPKQGRHAVQVEINRALYMDERLIRPNENFGFVKNTLNKVMGNFIGAAWHTTPLAAE